MALTDTIAQLVSSRGSDQAEPTSNHKNSTYEIRERDIWNQLADRDLFRLSFDICTNLRLSTRLNHEDLGLDPNVVGELAGGYRKNFSDRLKQARTKLSTMQKTFNHEFTVYAAPFRFVAEDSLEEAIAFIESVKAEAEVLRAELMDSWEEQFQDYLEQLGKKLNETIPDQDERIDRALIQYAQEFPSKQEFSRALEIRVDGPIKIASLATKLKGDATLQTELARQAKTQQELETERQNLETQARSQQMLAHGIAQALNQAQHVCLDECWGIMASLVDRFSSKSPEELTGRDRQAINAAFKRLDVLEAHNPAIGSLAEKAKVLKTLLTKGCSAEEAQAAFDEFSGFLAERCANADTEGAIDLKNSLRFTDDYKALSAELQQLINHPNPERLQQISNGRLANTEAVLSRRIASLKKLQKEAQKAAEQAEASLGTNPDCFDAIAGF